MIWRRLRRRWHQWTKGLSREAAEDLLDGLDQGEPCGRPPAARTTRAGRPGPRPPACPGLPTLGRLEALDRGLRAGGPVQQGVLRGVGRDLAKGP